MAVMDLYSKRRRRELGNLPDVVTYDVFPAGFRAQLSYLARDALGDRETYSRNHAAFQSCKSVVEILRREHGVHFLTRAALEHDYYDDLHQFIQGEQNVDRLLDLVELLAAVCQMDESNGNRPHGHADKFVEELNDRFKEHALGYQYEANKVIRTDSKILHEQVVRPALAVLTDPDFSNANSEMLEAFEHHRHGREKDVLTWALKAMESTLKIICAARGWAVSGKGQAKDLLDTVFNNGLIDPHWQTEFAGLRAVLESGVPTARNKLGGHGQGTTPTAVPAYLAAFVLHQTAAAILFLVDAHKAKP